MVWHEGLHSHNQTVRVSPPGMEGQAGGVCELEGAHLSHPRLFTQTSTSLYTYCWPSGLGRGQLQIMISRAEFSGAASPHRGLACGWCIDAGHSHSKLVYGDHEGKELVTAQTSLQVINYRSESCQNRVLC